MTHISKHSETASNLLLLILLGTLCAQTFSLRVASTSKSLSASESESLVTSTLESNSDSSTLIVLSSTAMTWFSCVSPIQDNNWSYSKGFKKITCAGKTYVGPYGQDGKITSPTFLVAPHHGIIISFQLALLDSWDSETFRIKIDDDEEVYYKKHNHKTSTTTNTCKNSEYSDTYENVTFGFPHVANTLTLVISSNIDDGASDESWGICNLIITATPYPIDSAGNPLTIAAPETTNTFFACSSPPNEPAWTYTDGYSKITCSGKTYVGPYGAGAMLISPQILLTPHQGITVSFKMAWIDSWDSESFIVTANSKQVWSKSHNHKTSSPSNTCRKDWKDAYETITFGFNHTESYLVLAFKSTLDDIATDEAWGICDLVITTLQSPVTSSGSTIPTSGASSSPGYTLSSVFPTSLNYGCLNLNTVANTLTSALSYLSGANSLTKPIIDSTVNMIVTALQNNGYTGDVSSSNVCLGNFDGSYITEEIDECSAMLLQDSSRYSVISFNVPVPGGFCSALPGTTTASFCVALGSAFGLPSLSIQANAGALSCLATATGSGAGYVLGTALGAGLDTVSLGVSLTSSLEKRTTLFTGKIEDVQISGNYYDYISLEIDPATFELPSVFEISGSATRVIRVTDNTETWVSKLINAKNVQDVAFESFGDLSMLVAIEAGMTLALAGQTQGLLPDLGPYQLGLGTLYATTSPITLVSGHRTNS